VQVKKKTWSGGKGVRVEIMLSPVNPKCMGREGKCKRGKRQEKLKGKKVMYTMASVNRGKRIAKGGGT